MEIEEGRGEGWNRKPRHRSQTIWGLGSFAPARYGGNNQKCVNIAKFGVRKHLFSTYLAEFIWRYMHRDEDLFSVFLNDVKKVYATSTTKR